MRNLHTVDRKGTTENSPQMTLRLKAAAGGECQEFPYTLRKAGPMTVIAFQVERRT